MFDISYMYIYIKKGKAEFTRKKSKGESKKEVLTGKFNKSHMGRRDPAHTARFRIILMVMVVAMTMAARADRINKPFPSYSAVGSREDESIKNVNHEDFDGGFSSLEGMLQWAIGVFSG